NGHVLKSGIGGAETPVNFTAAVPFQPHGFKHKTRDFDSTSPQVAKGIYAPTLSPDGKQIAFVALNQMYVMSVGGAPVALTHDQ
ncbi:DPP IV N-terminal domain-containing protein, partial [Escherichia coli]|uniref:DPP IV N-terminal domain-containing protein n=1 Tax=Escherichia coli TaxID=562 RepID=UPI00142D292B